MEKITALPRHVAIIMDGNGRWAEKRGLPRMEGHRAGVNNIRPIIKSLNNHGVEYLTIYAFSTENWNRPDNEVHGLLGLLEDIIDEEARELHKNGVKIRHIGSLDRLSTALQESVKIAVDLTAANKGITLGVALNYGGREEILNAIRNILKDNVKAEDMDDKLLGEYLQTTGLADVDLVIRTGGEIRISNFLIWQTAYSEFYFTQILWPDFNKEELEKALTAYSQRQRRFGGL